MFMFGFGLTRTSKSSQKLFKKSILELNCKILEILLTFVCVELYFKLVLCTYRATVNGFVYTCNLKDKI